MTVSGYSSTVQSWGLNVQSSLQEVVEVKLVGSARAFVAFVAHVVSARSW